MEDKEKFDYNDKSLICDLSWHDEAKRDYLVVTNANKFKDVMNARAKGTTVYELINLYGGIDNVTQAFAERGIYDDVSDVPEFGNDESYEAIINRLQNQINQLSEKVNNDSNESVNKENLENKEG